MRFEYAIFLCETMNQYLRIPNAAELTYCPYCGERLTDHDE